MRQLEASIKTFNLDHVKVTGDLQGSVPSHGRSWSCRLPKVRVRVTVPDMIADEVVALLAEAS